MTIEQDLTKIEIGDYCNLNSQILTTLKKQGVERLFPVQELVIPEIVRPSGSSSSLFPLRDVCVSAPTGSGKTLSYVLPIVHNLSDRKLRRIRALVVVPVVNLAKQVAEVFNTYCTGTDLKTVLLCGKQNFDTECNALYEKVPNFRHANLATKFDNFLEIATADIVVATPGRLLEHLRSNGDKFCLKYLSYLILDEADRLMNDFRSDWLSEIEYAVYEADSDPGVNVTRRRITIENLSQLFDAGQLPLQKVLLSATLSHNPEQIKRLNLFFPKYLSISSQGTSEEFTASTNTGIPAKLQQSYVNVELKLKPLAVFLLVTQNAYKKTLCFVAKKESSRKLSHVLQKLNVQGVSDISSKVNKYRMQRDLNKFRKQETGILICTDVMARGMDIDNIDCVINYDCPKLLRTYVHRVGRTARADCEGCAVTLIENSEAEEFRKMFAHNDNVPVEITLKKEDFEQHMNVYKEALADVKKDLEAQNEAARAKMRFRKGPRKRVMKIGK